MTREERLASLEHAFGDSDGVGDIAFLFRHIRTLESDLTTARAETAAVLENLADKWHQTLFPEHTPYNQGQELGMEKCADDLRTAITIPQAAALREHEDKVIGQALADATVEIGKTGKLTIDGTVIDFLSHSTWLAAALARVRLEEAEWWAENRMHMILPFKPEMLGPRGRDRLAELRAAASPPASKEGVGGTE